MNRMYLCPKCTDSAPLDLRGRFVPHRPQGNRFACSASGRRPAQLDREERERELARSA